MQGLGPGLAGVKRGSGTGAVQGMPVWSWVGRNILGNSIFLVCEMPC